MRAHLRTHIGMHGPYTPMHQVPTPAQQVSPPWALEPSYLCSDPVSFLGTTREWKQGPSRQVPAPQHPLVFAWSGQLEAPQALSFCGRFLKPCSCGR